jgi:hypothetical protein
MKASTAKPLAVWPWLRCVWMCARCFRSLSMTPHCVASNYPIRNPRTSGRTRALIFLSMFSLSHSLLPAHSHQHSQSAGYRQQSLCMKFNSSLLKQSISGNKSLRSKQIDSRKLLVPFMLERRNQLCNRVGIGFTRTRLRGADCARCLA